MISMYQTIQKIINNENEDVDGALQENKNEKNTESNTHDIHLEDISLQEITNTISKERKMGQ